MTCSLAPFHDSMIGPSNVSMTSVRIRGIAGRIELVAGVQLVGDVTFERRFHLAADAEVLHVLDQRIDFVIGRQQGERGHRGAGNAVVDDALSGRRPSAAAAV